MLMEELVQKSRHSRSCISARAILALEEEITH